MDVRTDAAAYRSKKIWGIQSNFESDNKMSPTYDLDNILHDSYKITVLFYLLALEKVI